MKTQYGWSPNCLFLSNPQARKHHNYGDSWHRDLNIKDGMTPDVAVPICAWSCCKGSCCWRCGRDVRSRGQRVQSLFAKKVDDSMKKGYCHISLSQCVRYVYVVYVYIYICNIWYTYTQYMIYEIWYMIYIYILYYIYIHYACTDQMPQDRHFHRNDMTTVTRAAATGNLHCSCRGFSRVVTRWIKLALMWFHGIFP